MNPQAKLLMALADEIVKTDYHVEEVMCSAYEAAEEVIMAKGDVVFEREFNLLSEIVKTNQPVILDLAHKVDEKHAWAILTELALEAEVVEDLTEEQKTSLVELSSKYDDGIDIFISKEKTSLTVKQIAQIYLAQTISFYYVFDKAQINDFDHGDVIETLINA